MTTTAQRRVATALLVVAPLAGCSDGPGSSAPSETSTPSEGSSDDEVLDLMSATLDGWHQLGAGGFTVEEVGGEVLYRTEGGLGLLWHERVVTDFRLDLEVRVGTDRANSGIFLRVPSPPTSPGYISGSPEVQIDTGGEGTSATGAVYSVTPPLVDVDLDAGTWHRLQVEVRGDHLTVTIDDTVVQDTSLAPGGVVSHLAPSGHVGLQNHSDQDVVEFRRVQLRPLGD